VIQAFNLSIPIVALVSYLVAGFLTLELGRLVLIALPGTLVGARIGRYLFTRVDDALFGRIILVLLMLCGFFIAVTALW